MTHSGDAMLRLQTAVHRRETGTLFINTPDGHAGIISYRDGVIEGVVTGRFRGNEALNYLSAAGELSYRHQERMTPLPHSTPDAEWVAKVLGTSTARTASMPSQPSAPVADSSNVSEGASHDADAEAVKTEALKLIEKELAEFTGPIASMLIEEIALTIDVQRMNALQFDALLESLGAHIIDPNEAKRFKQRARKHLGVLFR